MDDKTLLDGFVNANYYFYMKAWRMVHVEQCNDKARKEVRSLQRIIRKYVHLHPDLKELNSDLQDLLLDINYYTKTPAIGTRALVLVSGAHSTSGIIDLRALYEDLYYTLPWPRPIPRPERVTFRWRSRFVRTCGQCWVIERIIDINDLYQDQRLAQELEYLMTHEAAHFMWANHSKPFKTFLKSVGVPKDYASAYTNSSELFLAVEAERRPKVILRAS